MFNLTNQTCKACGGSGVYRNSKYSRVCFRCKGKGWMSKEDIARYDAWHRTRGYEHKKTFNDHDNKYELVRK